MNNDVTSPKPASVAMATVTRTADEPAHPSWCAEAACEVDADGAGEHVGLRTRVKARDCELEVALVQFVESNATAGSLQLRFEIVDHDLAIDPVVMHFSSRDTAAMLQVIGDLDARRRELTAGSRRTGKEFAAQRKAREESLRDLSARTGIPKSQLRAIEAGDVAPVGATLVALTAALFPDDDLNGLRAVG